MANIIGCDGGCGAQSPDPETRLHVANGWLTVRARYLDPFEQLSERDDRKYCDECAPAVLKALGLTAKEAGQ